MPPKPAVVTKSSDGDAADHEKEFVEKELTISFLKTRLSRCKEQSLPMMAEEQGAVSSDQYCTLQAPGAW